MKLHTIFQTMDTYLFDKEVNEFLDRSDIEIISTKYEHITNAYDYHFVAFIEYKESGEEE